MLDLLRPIAEQYAFNGSLFAIAFDDLSGEEARTAPGPGSSSIHWIGGHLVTARYHTLQLLRKKAPVPWEGRFESSVPAGEQAAVSIERIIDEWNRVTPVLMSALAGAEKRLLHTAPPTPFPTIEQNTLAALAFMANHEAYHLGQISYARRLAGKTPLVEQLLANTNK